MRIGVGIGVDRARRGASFSPLDLEGLNLWLDASLGVTTDAFGVTAWEDQSGNGFDATQSVDANKPDYLASGGVSGAPGVDFNGTSEFLVNTSTLTSHSLTAFAVVNDRLLAGSRCLFGTASSSYGLLTDRTSQVCVYDGAFRLLGANVSGEQFLTWHLDETGPAAEGFRNGSSIGTSAATGLFGSFTGTNARIGALGGGAATWHFDGILTEALIYDRALTSGELAQVHDYLAGRYGL